MGLLFLAAFICVPIIEIIGFIQIGSLIGLWPTIGIVILTAVAGSLLLQHQGMTALMQAQHKLREGTIPVDEVIDGFCLALAGALLLTPGFFTDTFGFLLFIPPFRRGFARFFFEKVIQPNAVFYTNGGRQNEQPFEAPSDETGPRGSRFDDGVVIDGTFEDVSEKKSSSSTLHVPDVTREGGEEDRQDQGGAKKDQRDPKSKNSPWQK